MDRLAALSRAHRLVEELATRTAESSLRAYLAQAWAVLEPGTAFTPGWHLDAICDHGEAVLNGDIKNLIVNIAPRHSKPCDVDGMVLERTRGRIALGDVRVGDHVLTHRGRFRPVAAVHEQGILPVLAITTHTGRTLRVAADHPLLTTRGWVEAQHLTLADTLGEVHAQEVSGAATVTACEARLLGYLIGDGSVNDGGKLFTNQDRETLDDFIACTHSVGFIPTERPRLGKAMQNKTVVTLRATQQRKGRARTRLGPVRVWLTRHGLDGKCSYDKRVPPALFAATPDLIAEFVGAYWACDGYVAKRDGRVSECCIGCNTVSRGLAFDIQHLLNRLGIQARIRTMRAPLKTRRQGDWYTSYQVNITSINHGSKFAACVPVRHSKKRPLLARYTRSGFDRILNEDRIVSIEGNSQADCRCLTVEDDHSFAYQDLAVHNSTVISKALPTYAWITQPELRFMYASYSASLSIEHAVHSRQVIESPWYRARWGHIVELTTDQNIKCLAAGTLIQMGDGTQRAVENIRVGDSVQSTDGLSVTTDCVTMIVQTGRQRVLKIVLSDGSTVRVTPTHRLFGWDEWVTAGNLSVGDPLAVMRRSLGQSGDLSVDDAFLVSLWIAEGGKHACSYDVTTTEPIIVERLHQIAATRGWKVHRHGDAYMVSAGRRRLGDTPVNLLRAHGAWGQTTDSVRVPTAVFAASDAAVGEFIATYIACDGCVNAGPNYVIDITSASEGLIHDLRVLLKRFCVRGDVRQFDGKYRHNGSYIMTRPQWRLHIGEAESIGKLAHLSIYGKAMQFKRLLQTKTASTRYPGGRAASIPPAWRQELRHTSVDVGTKGWATRRIALAAARVDGNAALARKLDSDLDWRVIVSIEDEPPVDTYDLETAQHHCFFADTVLSHNSHYQNTRRGYRIATSVGGTVTGRGADILVCVEGDTLITTDQGALPIRDIVEKRLPVRILGSSGRYQAIEAYERTPGRTLVEIETADGDVLRCTEDHPIFVEGAGYVRADVLIAWSAHGDVCLRSLRSHVRSGTETRRACATPVLLAGVQRTLSTRASAASAHKVYLRGLWSAVRSTAGACRTGTARAGVFSSVLRHVSAWTQQPAVGWWACWNHVPTVWNRLLRESCRGASPALLFLCVPGRGVAGSTTTRMLDVPEFLHPEAGARPTLLQPNVCERRVANEWARASERPVDRWPLGTPLYTGLYEDAAAGNRRTRWAGMRSLSEHSTPAGASHRCLGQQSRADESGDALYVVSPDGPHEDRDQRGLDEPVRLRAVRRCPAPAFVYNLRVAPDHDYYANGILTHNCDDPHNLEEVDSDVVRARDKKWYREVWTTRLNDPKTGRKIVIAQRGHEDDLSADLIASGDYETLVLPTEYVPTPWVSVRGWKDPRTTPGELLCPARFGAEENARAKRELGDKYSAQHQQTPTPPGGKLLQREWFAIVDAVPADAQVVRRVRGWDAAATAGGGDWTVGVRLARTRDGLIYIEDVVRVQVGPGDDENLMHQTATLDGRAVDIIEEEEGGSSGKKVIAAHAKRLAGYSYKGERSTGDKVTRAKPFVAQARVGNVRLVRGAWNKAYLDELAAFPGGPFDDQIDGTTKAYNEIALAPVTTVKPRKFSGF
jgi:predicted phage terminase large subunit-like protein